jgi:murein DD-endopeptidase MepM/ murein hydrolase activator NlpD
MVNRLLSRVLALAIVALAAGTAGAAPASHDVKEKTAQPELTLQPYPTRVYKAPDRSHDYTVSWIFSLMVQSSEPLTLAPESMEIDLLGKSGVLLRHTTFAKDGFAPLTYTTALPPKLPDGTSPPHALYWPLAIRLRGIEPATLPVEAMRISIKISDEHGRLITATRVVPIESYAQRTHLIFPFHGKGIILQAGAMNGGHRNRSGEYALDGTGLDDAWSPVKPGDGKSNSDYPGFGRDLIAPAAGSVVHVRKDRPDQPVGDASDAQYYAPEYKRGGDPGNFVVIDHGNGEFSMIAHFESGSLNVNLGDKVIQGQVLGKLGHSGDTDSPHVHYQLQAGADWEYSDALPCQFDNIEQKVLDRGSYFEAK